MLENDKLENEHDRTQIQDFFLGISLLVRCTTGMVFEYSQTSILLFN